MKEKEVNEFNDLINLIWKDQNCPICKKKDTFLTSNNVFEWREFHKGNLSLGGNNQIFPVLPIVCSHCGYTIPFNFLVIKKLLDANKNEDKKK